MHLEWEVHIRGPYAGIVLEHNGGLRTCLIVSSGHMDLHIAAGTTVYMSTVKANIPMLISSCQFKACIIGSDLDCSGPK